VFENKVLGNKFGLFRQRSECFWKAKPRRLKWARHSSGMEDKSTHTEYEWGNLFITVTWGGEDGWSLWKWSKRMKDERKWQGIVSNFVLLLTLWR